MAKPKVLVLPHGNLFTDLFPPQVKSSLEVVADPVYIDHQLTQEELATAVANVEAIITGWGSPQITAEIATKAPKLRFIGHAAGSIRSLIEEAIFDTDIVVTHAAAAIAPYVAETSLTLALMLLRRIPDHDARIKAGGEWKNPDTEPETLFRQRVGLIGFGIVAKEFVKLLRPFQAAIIAYDPYLDETTADWWHLRRAALDDVLRQSKVISIHAASLPRTRHLLNAEKLKLIRDGAILINTARGALIDQEALTAELKTGRFCVALDVFDPEPLTADSPLRSLPNVILTPHIAGAAKGRRSEMSQMVIDDLKLVLSGQEPKHRVTKEMLRSMA